MRKETILALKCDICRNNEGCEYKEDLEKYIDSVFNSENTDTGIFCTNESICKYFEDRSENGVRESGDREM